MYNLMVSFIGGFLITSLLFFICLLIVLGGKILFIFLSEIYRKKPNILLNREIPVKKVTVKKPVKHNNSVKKPVKPIRSIEINPDEIDKIYVKKI